MAWQTSLSIVLCALLGGCGTPRASWFPVPSARASQEAPGPVDFNWVLSGEKQVGPMQVFSDGTQTWMQWRPNQPLPAILAMQESGYAVVEYRRQDPYTIITGVYPSLMFRAGHYWAKASRSSLAANLVQSGTSAAASHHGVHPGAEAAADMAQPKASLANSAQSNDPYGGFASTTSNPAPANRSNAPQPQQRFVANTSKTQVSYAVSRADQHLRQALGRWANLSGWRFDPEHWSVDVDIPVSAEASFSDDFVDSVQALLSSTELSDRPVQPCFYTNQVLRVVPLAEACDRTVVSPESA